MSHQERVGWSFGGGFRWRHVAALICARLVASRFAPKQCEQGRVGGAVCSHKVCWCPVVCRSVTRFSDGCRLAKDRNHVISNDD